MSNKHAVWEIKEEAERMEELGSNMGEDLGAPYREAAEKLHEVADRYAETVGDSGENVEES